MFNVFRIRKEFTEERILRQLKMLTVKPNRLNK